MPTLSIDMPSGIAGDMLLAALLACGGDRERLERDLLALGVGPIRIHAKPVMAGAMAATLVDVDAEQEPRWIQAPTTLRNDERRTTNDERATQSTFTGMGLPARGTWSIRRTPSTKTAAASTHASSACSASAKPLRLTTSQ